MDPMMDQSGIIAFLEDPRSYGLQGQSVQRIDTHGAIVFLAGEFVFKIKRAVAYPYMDFSTLEKRYRACLREIEINQPHAPSIYLDLVPINCTPDGQLEIGGEGEPVEWAVKMHRFSQEDLLSSVAARGEIDFVLATKIADTVSAYHDQALRIDTDSISNTLSDILEGVSKNLSGFPKGVSKRPEGVSKRPEGVSKREVLVFQTLAQRRILSCTRLLDARARSGFVRHCHGDLHLQNIVLIDGAPTLFDAIEFDDRLAQIDVLYDLAFLLADLDHRGLRASANTVLNRYLFRQNHKLNIYALGLLPLYLALRLAIRAMVTLDRVQHVKEEEAQETVEIAKSYFAGALRCLDPVPPRLIVVGGLSGSGKSTLAKNLAPFAGPSPGAFHLRSDLERKLFFKVEETTRLDNRYYTQEISDQIYDILYRKAEMALKVGHTVIVDAVFSKDEERHKIEDVARRLNIPFDGFWLDAPEQVLINRVENRKEDASDATANVVKIQKAADIGTISWNKIDSSGTKQEMLQSARALINL